MMKLFRLFLLFLFPTVCLAQPHGNEWINYNQQYLKIQVNSTGIYNLDYNTLNSGMASIGVSLATIDPRNIQLFTKGKELPIDIIGESDGSFDASDHIIFYAEKNDGWFDAGLYENPTEPRINPYYSLISDTSSYFLTWNNLPQNNRYKASENTNFTSKTSQPYFFSQSIGFFTNQYSVGKKDASGAATPFYDEGEGWVSATIAVPSTRFTYLSTKNLFKGTSAPASTFTTTFAGISNASGSPNHRLQVLVNSNQIIDTSFAGYDLTKKTIQLNASSFGSQITINYKNLPLTPAPATDYMAAGYAFIEFPHSNSLAGESYVEMWIPQSSDTLYYDFTNYTAGPINYLYDTQLGIKYKVQQSGSRLQVLIAPGSKRKCILTSTNSHKSSNQIKPVSNIQNSQGYFTNYSNLAGDSAYLIVSHPTLWSATGQFASYKSLVGHSTLLVSVIDLYDQYAHGIYQHPLAIKNFVEDIQSANPNAPPNYLFLAGKSVKETSTRKNINYRNRNKVPTIGNPPADNLFGADLSGESSIISIAIGRIAAATNADLINYLDKVRQYDQQKKIQPSTIKDAIWKKRAIHFIGGNNEFEQITFSNYMSGLESNYTAPKMNGFVHTYKRFNTGASGTIQFDTVQQIINSGISLMSFFGHGSNGQLGIDLGGPSDYSFQGRFPLFIANSCNVGDYHLPNENAVSVNEKWILTKDKGAIGFIASSSVGYPSYLNKYNSGIYTNLSNANYGKSIGKIMQAASEDMNSSNAFDIRTAIEMNLHGDPSLSICPVPLADFAIEREFVNAPEIVSADNSNFQISVPVYNLGIGTDSVIKIQLLWRYPNGRDSLFIQEFRDNSIIHSVLFDLPIDEKNAIGENTFSIHVNPELTVNEIYPTQNNIINGIRINITSDDLIPIWPKNYAIVPNKKVQLAANTADLFAPEGDYVFELDINDQYNSPMKKTTTISSKGGVLTWDPKIEHAPDSIVYYWRCSPKKANPADFKWREHSFQIILEKEGWSQYDFEQFKNNRFQTLLYSKGSKTFDFINGSIAISGSTKGYPSGSEYSNVKWSLNGEQQGRVSFCGGRASMLISVIDPVTLQPWVIRTIDNSVSPPIINNANRNYGNYNDPSNGPCPSWDLKFMFRVTEPAEMDSMISMITKHVPDSFYLLIMTGNRSYFRDSTMWKERHLKVFEDLGSDSIRTIKTDQPIILFTQKGNPSKTIEVIGAEPTSAISVTTSISAKIGKGTMESVIIGPAKDWKKLSWSHSSNSSNDSMKLNITGIDIVGNEQSVADLLGTQKDMSNLAQQFPSINKYNYLKLTGSFFDKTNFTSPHLNKWQIYHSEVPEFAIDPGKLFRFHNDTVLQGEPVILESQFVNASRIDAKNLKIRAYLRGEKNEISELPVRTISDLKAWQTKDDSLIVNTVKLGGHYTLTLELNPLDTSWQPEGSHFNNLIQKSFFVKSDRLNPLLDVTFDGIHILDGDIVSARPEIRMSLNDENQFLPLNDTSNFEVYLTDPNKNQTRVYFVEKGNEIMTFEPSNGKKNAASIQYSPILKVDGIYTLSVNANDASGNRSGDSDFEITFEIINRSTITHVMNYPNPFTTRTQFVFTLTGYKIPDLFRIQILTISGRVIREIDKHELGHLHIGRNITEYAWDGRDEFGDRLANGVYFYRVLTKIEGETVEHRDSGADGYFKKEFGKMYLMR